MKWCFKIFDVLDGYYICYLSDDMIYGVVCKFGCYVGYELKGVLEIMCN